MNTISVVVVVVVVVVAVDTFDVDTISNPDSKNCDFLLIPGSQCCRQLGCVSRLTVREHDTNLNNEIFEDFRPSVRPSLT